MQIKDYRFQLILLMLTIFFLLFYIGRINYDYIDSEGDNYTYEIFSETVFSNSPFKVNVKFDYYDEHDIYHHQRSFPPLFPIVLAVIHLIFGSGMRISIFANSVIGVMCALPIYLICERLGNKWMGLLAVFVSLISPTLQETSITGLSEPLFLFTSLWAIYFLLCFSENGRKLELIWAGLLSGLAYLTRSSGVALVASGALFLFWESDLRFNKSVWIKKATNLIVYLGVFIVVVSPWLIRNYLVFGDAMYYVGRFATGLKAGTLHSAANMSNPTLGAFLSQASLPEIIDRYLRVIRIHSNQIVNEMGIMILFVVFGILLGYFREKKYSLIWIYLFMNLFILLFSPGLQLRHLIAVFTIIAILGSAALVKLYQRYPLELSRKYRLSNWLASAILLISLGGLLLLSYRGFAYSRPPKPQNLLYPQIGQWLKENSPPDAVIMSDPTSPIYYYARRPLIMFPREPTVEVVRELIEKYQVKYLVVFHKFQLNSLRMENIKQVKRFTAEDAGQKCLALVYMVE